MYALYFICVLISFVYILPGGEAVRCYACNSQHDPSCGDPFYPVSVPLINCDAKIAAQLVPRSNMCKKVSRRMADGTYHIIRDCANMDSNPSDGQMCVTQPGGEFACRCFGDACNSALSVNSSGTLFSTLLIAVLFLVFRL